MLMPVLLYRQRMILVTCAETWAEHEIAVAAAAPATAAALHGLHARLLRVCRW